MRTATRTRLLGASGSVVLATLISACAAADAAPNPSPSRDTTGSYSSQMSVEQFAGIDLDYDPLATPAALAEQSRFVVAGTVERVQEGRVQIVTANEEAAGISTIVLVLRDAKFVLGAAERNSDGFVYVELPNPGQQEPLAYQDGLRSGASVVAYLLPASDGEPADGVDTAIADAKAGRPAGQALYQPVGPQALILQFEDEAVVWPLIGEQREGKLEDTLPSGNLIAPTVVDSPD